ncbi:two-partner secretion domain-containing protein [Falsiroseomonas tokyonensis]|uniref:Filamentous hemagglutinin N-terminal domain-containing protein n=1 Tax=Falsiroseomonas tokyonensis TaxID=430521 RepID=A0ABV7BS26_9PROT|nr:filamentous hemagglutinin N-terminal domain-containing protein [Falsiroseomonas tokyonensis]MBU8537225.1 filamentous hemagglutinin N-terminal domain-containing protein [Falsiroseomonas tokyonensis]
MRRRPTFLAPGLLAAASGLAAAPAAGQAPDARPSGGAVVAGQASISQTASRTQVNQASDRAVIEWQRFDVGRNHQVDIRQPAATSWSLNRVTGGDPSAIAGRVTSNGGVALVNPAGVVFHQGAQVDVGALIATTSDITNQNFVAGRMVFDGAPRPGARVENRGQVTVAQQGLAALVGPQVANSGTIRARLGRVALAAGEAFALDLAGDGLLALDVTRQVATAPSGATALVTQSGTIEAEGGSVLLSARAASGVLENLVQAGGSTSAAQVALRAEGGGVRIDGALAARSIEATASGTVQASGTARITASPGGQVTLGAGAESRIGQPRRLSARTTVARGAEISAPGGTVIVHAAERTEMRGAITAEGGAIEVSSRGALALDGVMQAGANGTVLVDPVTLRVVTTLSGATEPAEITAASIGATTGALTLQAEQAIRVEAAIQKPTGRLTLETTSPTAQGIEIRRDISVTGDLVLRSAGDITQSASGAALDLGTLEAQSSAGAVRLNAAANTIRAIAGGSAATRFDVTSRLAMSIDGPVTAADIALETPQTLSLFAPLTATNGLDLFALRGVSQQASGAGVTAGLLRLDSALGPVALAGEGNGIARLGDAFVPQGLALTTTGPLEVAGGVNAGLVTLEVRQGDLTQAANSRLVAETLQLRVPDGQVRLDAALNGIAQLYGEAGDRLLVATAGDLLLSAPLSAPEIALRLGGGLTQDQGARLSTIRLDLDALGAVTLADPSNAIATLGTLRSDGAISLATSGALDLLGSVTAPSVTLAAGGALRAGAGSALVTDRARLTGGSVGVNGGGHAFGVLAGGGATGDFRLELDGDLRLDGALTVGGALALEAAALSLEAPVTAGSARLRARLGDVTQDVVGAIRAGRLVAEAPAGQVLLAAAANDVAQIGGTALGDFAFRGSGDAAPDPLAGLAGARLLLEFGGSFRQSPTAAAGLSTPRLLIQAGGSVELRGPANAVAELGASSAPGGLALHSSQALNLAAPLSTGGELDLAGTALTQSAGASLSASRLLARASAGDVLLEDAANSLPRLGPGSATGQFRVATSGTMTLEGALSAGDTVSLLAADSLDQATSGAGIAAPRLLARSVFGNVTLLGSGNSFGALGASGAAGDFALAQQGPLALGLEGPIAAPTLFFRTENGLTDVAGGALRGATLRLETAGPVRLDAAGRHAVDSVGGRAGSLALAVDGSLQVTEALAAPGALTLSAAQLGLLAPVAAGTAQLEATAGDITQTLRGAGLSATILTARAMAGQVLLDGQGNRVAALGAGGASGGFAIAQEGSAPLLLTGGIAAGTIYLRAETGIQDGPGARLSTGLLRLDTPGAAQFGQVHDVALLGGQLGALTLSSSDALAVEEALDLIGALNLSAASLRFAAPVSAGGATLQALSGDIFQEASGAGLRIGSGGLRLSATGNIALEGAGNAVPLLRGASAQGSLGLLSTGAMTVSGTASGADVVLRSAGPMRLDGAVLQADRAVLLASPQGFGAGAASRLVARDAAALPVLLMDSRTGGLTAIPVGLAADRPGLAPAQQPTQLASFGPAQAAPAGPAVFALEAGAAPVFLLLDRAAVLGTLEAGRLGVLGQGGSAFLLGTLGGVGGEAAARLVAVPAASPGYQFNNCVMAASTCSGLPPPVTPPVDPPVIAPPVVPPVVDPPVLPPVVVVPDPGPLLRVALPANDTAPRLAEWDLRRGVPTVLVPGLRRPEDEEE